jgi:zinc/manganese transport system ATP-binding protein
MTAIELSNVTLALGRRTVLADVNLTVEGPEFIGVFGPNGAGKTTLMRALLGLVRPSSGAISVLGKPASRGNAAVGYVPQIRASSSSVRLSGWAVVASVFNSHRLGLPVLSKAGAREVAWALDMAGAQTLANRPLTDMSGGERQRIFLPRR